MARESSVGFTRDDDNRPGKALDRWWNSDSANVARDLTSYCAALERGQRLRRFKNYSYHILATKRAPISFALAMPATSMYGAAYAGELFDAEFEPPAVNYCAIAVDTFKNRIFTQHPHLQFLPVMSSDYKIRTSCRQATAFVDQLFNDVKAWPLIQAAAVASSIVGTGWLFVDGDKETNEVLISHIDDDCVLLDPSAGENPRAKQIRLFHDRDTLMRRYPDHAKALADAPGCRPGFYEQESLGYLDTIAVIDAYHSPLDGSKGRHVVCVDDILLVDEGWEGEAPLAKISFDKIAGQPRGVGAVEQIAPLQREIDRLADVIAEIERTCAYPRPQSRIGNQVTPEDLSGMNLIEYAISPVEFQPGVMPSPQLYQHKKDLGQDALLQVGLSSGQAQGLTEPGITAGTAIESALTISDVRHRGLSIGLEEFVEDVGHLVLKQAAVVKPKVVHRGQKIDFESVEKALKSAQLDAFPINGLPQSISGRRQELSDRLAKGQITKSTYARQLDLPVIEDETDEEAASESIIEQQIDEMIETGEFQPPLPYTDLERLVQIGIARYQIEWCRKLPADRLQLVASYIALAKEKLSDQPSQAPAPGPGGPSAPDAGAPAPGAPPAP